MFLCQICRGKFIKILNLRLCWERVNAARRLPWEPSNIPRQISEMAVKMDLLS